MKKMLMISNDYSKTEVVSIEEQKEFFKKHDYFETEYEDLRMLFEENKNLKNKLSKVENAKKDLQDYSEKLESLCDNYGVDVGEISEY